MKRTLIIAALLIAATLNAQQVAAPKVNVNTATLAQLCYLPGIGRVIGQRIVDYRTERGQFHKVSDLLQVKGTAEKKLATMAPFVVLSGATTATAKIHVAKAGAK